MADVYTLVLAVLVLTMGSLADRIGPRLVYLIGPAIVGAASLACSPAWSPAVLIGVRRASAARRWPTAFAPIGSSTGGRTRTGR